eukprot:Seg4482.1 transcript_id=Seg4482.1/GoldUCD/mRNA.D3Y31 product="hypothetical protein" protein_id=Seg4482.1/GoldUCD/D3Y31
MSASCSFAPAAIFSEKENASCSLNRYQALLCCSVQCSVIGPKQRRKRKKKKTKGSAVVILQRSRKHIYDVVRTLQLQFNNFQVFIL